MKQKIIFTFIFLVFAATAASLLAFLVLGKNVDKENKIEMLRRAERHLVTYIESEKIRIENIARDLADDSSLIDDLDLGNKRYLEVMSKRKSEKSSVQGILLYDFEGDYIAGNRKTSQQLSEFIKKRIKVSGNGEFHSGFWIEYDQIYLWVSGSIGKLANPSGWSFIIEPISAKAADFLQQTTTLRGSFIVHGVFLNLDLNDGVLKEFSLSQVPKNIGRRVPSYADQFYADKTYRFSSLKFSFTKIRDVAFLFIIPYPVGYIGMDKLIIFLFLFVSILIILGVPILSYFIDKPLNDLGAIMFFIDHFNYDDHETHSVVPTKSSESELLFSKLNDLIRTFITRISEADDRRVRAEKKWMKVADIVNVSPSVFKVFMENISVARHEYGIIESHMLALSERQECLEGHTSSSILGELMQIADTIKNDGILFRQREMQNDALHLEEFVQMLIRNKSKLTPQLVADIQQRFRSLFIEVDEYLDLRSKVLGGDSLKVSSVKVSNLQIQWLLSLTGRLFYLLQEPEVSSTDARRLHFEFAQAMRSLGKVDIRFYLDQYNAMIGTRLERSGKKMYPLDISGDHFSFDEGIMPYLSHILIQCIYNSVDHGIENQVVRTNRSKDPIGRISVQSNLIGSTHEIIIRDDGRGMDVESLSKKIIAYGLKTTTEIEGMSAQEIVKFVTTTEKNIDLDREKSKIRGIGFNSIHKLTARLGGVFEVLSQPQHGTTIKISIPSPVDGMRTQQSLFDARIIFSLVLKMLNPLLTPMSVHVSEVESNEEFFPVYTSKAIFCNACRDIISFLVLIYKANLRLSYEFIKNSREINGDHIQTVTLKFRVCNEVTTLELIKLAQAVEIKNIMNSTAGSQGFNLRVDPNKCAFEFDMICNLPESLPRRGVKVLILADETSDVESLLRSYFLSEFGGWDVEFFYEADEGRFLASDESSITMMIVEENSATSFMERARHCAELSEHALLMVTHEPIGVGASGFDFHKGDALVCRGKIDHSSIGRLVSRAAGKVSS